ncbi:VOC family protein [Pedobacter gandavensis]|uniref:VOC family protein n=1 Tax=Pedobacter gandavensis TaxID=2679963 RepID=A0ABR6EZY8_9SPHI|nr:VOC family protein [Pedobacter gandavensis]MBB2150819.1 VOC family protein [Pedobacter gandavensis]
MITISPYFTFSGNCREAMTFYQDCFGGVLNFQCVADAPLSDELPQPMKDCILQASLVKDNLVLMATDMVAEEGLTHGNSISMMVSFSNEDAIRQCYQKLSAGGQRSRPLELSFWGGLFGCVKDKYGNDWLLSLPQAQ